MSDILMDPSKGVTCPSPFCSPRAGRRAIDPNALCGRCRKMGLERMLAKGERRANRTPREDRQP